MKRLLIFLTIVLSWAAHSSRGQELEPRRWNHLPLDTSFAGVGYVYTTGDIAFDPVLQIEDAEVQMHTGVFKYIRTFEMFEKTARIDFLQGYQQGRWAGLLRGAPAATSRTGLSDTVFRFSMNLLGAPPLKWAEFAEYRKSMAESETIMGAGLAVHLPTGYYLDDKLLNLGTNRYTIQPQLGIVHNRGKWSAELTGASWIYTDNDEFFSGNHLEQDQLFTVQGQVAYTFRPGLWISAGLAYGAGGQSTLNGIEKDDYRENLALGVTAGIPVTRKFGLTFGYVGLRTQEKVGANLDSYTAGFSLLW